MLPPGRHHAAYIQPQIMIACLALVDPVTPIIAQLDGPLDLLGSTAEQFEFYLCDIDSSMLAAAAPNRIKKHADKLKPKRVYVHCLTVHKTIRCIYSVNTPQTYICVQTVHTCMHSHRRT